MLKALLIACPELFDSKSLTLHFLDEEEMKMFESIEVELTDPSLPDNIQCEVISSVKDLHPRNCSSV